MTMENFALLVVSVIGVFLLAGAGVGFAKGHIGDALLAGGLGLFALTLVVSAVARRRAKRREEARR